MTRFPQRFPGLTDGQPRGLTRMEPELQEPTTELRILSVNGGVSAVLKEGVPHR
jgi:hypothetical protein